MGQLPRRVGAAPCAKITRHARTADFTVRSDGYASEGHISSSSEARIKVIGVGGGGGNALNRMIEGGLQVNGQRGGETEGGRGLCRRPPPEGASSHTHCGSTVASACLAL
jgi:hypothetical protein